MLLILKKENILKLTEKLAPQKAPTPTPNPPPPVKHHPVRWQIPDLSSYNLASEIEREYGVDFHGQIEHLNCPFFHHGTGRSGAIKPRKEGGEVFVCGGNTACPARQRPVDVVRLHQIRHGLTFSQACQKLSIPIQPVQPDFSFAVEELLPLPDTAEKKIEKFPIHILPPVWQDYARQVSCSIGAPIDFIGMALFVVAGALIGNSRRIQIKEGWTEPSAIYWAGVYDISGGKTPSIGQAIKILSRLEEKLKDQGEKNKEKFYQEKMEYEIALAKWKKRKSKDSYVPTENAPTKPLEPTKPRTFTSDYTVESLSEILCNWPRGILLYMDELTRWVSGMNQYKAGKGTDRQFFLSAWAGAPGPVDRKGKDTLWIPRPFLSVLGGLPPEELSKFKSEVGHDGFFERILWSYPAYETHKWTDQGISHILENQIEDWFEYLFTMKTESYSKPQLIKVAGEPKKMFIEWFNNMKEEIKSTDTNPFLKGIWGKMISYCLRFALISTVLSLNDNMTEKEMGDAICLSEYFKENAKKVFGMVNQSDEEKSVTQIIKWAQTKNKIEISARDLYSYKVAGCTNAKAAKKKLTLLVEFSFARWKGKSTIILSENRENAENAE